MKAHTMNPYASLRRSSPTGSRHNSGVSAHSSALRHIEDIERRQGERYGKPSLSLREYLDELNDRLRRHPMYMEGMHFPHPQPGSTPMLAAALAWEGSWDCMGVFSSVIEEVARDYDLDRSA